MNKTSPVTVEFNDIENSEILADWCIKQKGFLGYTVIDVCDTDRTIDRKYTYFFDNEELAIWFKLTWE